MIYYVFVSLLFLFLMFLLKFGIGVNMEVVQFLVLTPFCFAQRRVDHSINYQYVLFYIPLAVSNLNTKEKINTLFDYCEVPMMIAIGYILATMMKIIRVCTFVFYYFIL